MWLLSVPSTRQLMASSSDMDFFSVARHVITVCKPRQMHTEIMLHNLMYGQLGWNQQYQQTQQCLIKTITVIVYLLDEVEAEMELMCSHLFSYLSCVFVLVKIMH